MTKRNPAIDIMKGLGILLVIFDHCDPISFELRRVFMSFMMPMFFFVGGFLYKSNSDILADTVKAARRLLLPYAAGVLILGVFTVYLGVVDMWHPLKMLVSGAGVEHFHCRYWADWVSVGAFWFFPAMFWCRVIFNFLFTRFSRFRYPVLITAVVAGYLLLRYVVRLPFGVSEGLSMMLFYLAGHAVRKIKELYPTIYPEWQRFVHIVAFVGVTAACFCWLWTIRYSTVVASAGFYQHSLLNIAGACGIICVYYYLCRSFVIYLPKVSRVLCFAGGGSLFLLWIHKLSLHFIFAYPFILHFQPIETSTAYVTVFLLLQYVFCLLCLMVASQSSTLRSFFGIYYEAPINNYTK